MYYVGPPAELAGIQVLSPQVMRITEEQERSDQEKRERSHALPKATPAAARRARSGHAVRQEGIDRLVAERQRIPLEESASPADPRIQWV